MEYNNEVPQYSHQYPSVKGKVRGPYSFEDINGVTVACAVCGWNYTHPTGLRSFASDALVLEMECEGGHSFTFKVEFYKGWTFIRTEAK